MTSFSPVLCRMINLAEANDGVTVLSQQTHRWRLRFTDTARGSIRREWLKTAGARFTLRSLRVLVSGINSAPLHQIDVIRCQTFDSDPGIGRIIVILPKIISQMALGTGNPERALRHEPAVTSADGFGDPAFGKTNRDFQLIAIPVTHHKAMLGDGRRTLFVEIAAADNAEVIFRLQLDWTPPGTRVFAIHLQRSLESPLGHSNWEIDQNPSLTSD